MKLLKNALIALTVCAMLGALVGCSSGLENGIGTVYGDKEFGFQLEGPAVGDTVAVLHTSLGDIYVRFFPEAAPKAVENFTTHAKNGYYNGLTFHRVIKDFMIQSGDPTGTGTGGENIWGSKGFADEFDRKLLNLRGSLVMANGGVNTNGSQFFINQVGPSGKTVEQLKADYATRNANMVKEVEAKYTEAYYDAMKAYYDSVYPGYMDSLYPSYKAFKEAIVRENTAPVVDAVPEEVWELYAKYGGSLHLDGAWRYIGGHTVFGQVYQGMDVVDAIASVKTGSNDKPETDVIINSIDVFTYEG